MLVIINFDYAKALGQASTLESIADDMRTLAKNYQNEVNSMRTEWTGDAANAFAAYCVSMSTQVNTEADELRRTATAIRTTARILHEAEEAAKRALEMMNRTL